VQKGRKTRRVQKGGGVCPSPATSTVACTSMCIPAHNSPQLLAPAIVVAFNWSVTNTNPNILCFSGSAGNSNLITITPPQSISLWKCATQFCYSITSSAITVPNTTATLINATTVFNPPSVSIQLNLATYPAGTYYVNLGLAGPNVSRILATSTPFSIPLSRPFLKIFTPFVKIQTGRVYDLPFSALSNITSTGFTLTWGGTENAHYYGFAISRGSNPTVSNPHSATTLIPTSCTSTTGIFKYVSGLSITSFGGIYSINLATGLTTLTPTDTSKMSATFTGLAPGTNLSQLIIFAAGCANSSNPSADIAQDPYMNALFPAGTNITLPSPPTINSMNAFSTNISIAFTNGLGNNITKYFTASVNGVETTLQTTALLQPYTQVTGNINISANPATGLALTPDTQYTIFIKMYGNFALTPENLQASTTPTIVTTGPPQLVLNTPATNITSTGFDITWNATPTATSYVCTITPAAGTYTITGTTARFTGLTAFTVYSCVVSGINSAGSRSTPSAGLVVRTLPNPPSKMVLAAGTAANVPTVSKIVLTWTGGTSVSGVTNTGTDFLTLTTPTISTAPTISGTTATFSTGITSNTKYTFIATTSNAGGSSVPSDPVSVTSLPAAPTDLTRSNVEATQCTLNWTAPPGTATITSYMVKIGTGAFSTMTTTGPTSGTITGLSPNAANTIVIAAVNATGRSADSSSLTVTTPPIPHVLSINTAPTAASTSFRIAWSGGTTTLVKPITFTVSPTGPTTTATVSPATFAGGVANTTYSITAVNAHTTNDLSSNSTPVSVTTAPTVAPVLNSSASTLLPDRFTIGWTPPSGNATMTYTFSLNGAAPPVAPTISGNSVTFTGLADDTNYSVTVVANNASGIPSPASAPVQVRTPISLAKLQASSSLQQETSSARQQGDSSATQQRDSSATQQRSSSAIVQALEKLTVSYRYMLFTIYGVRSMFPQGGGAQSGGGAMAPIFGNFTINNLDKPVEWNPDVIASAVHPYTLVPAVDTAGNRVVFSGDSTAPYPSVLRSGVVATIQPAQTSIGPPPSDLTVYVPANAPGASTASTASSASSASSASTAPTSVISSGPGGTGYRYFLFVISGIRTLVTEIRGRGGREGSSVEFGGFTLYNTEGPVQWNASATTTLVDSTTLTPVHEGSYGECMPPAIIYGNGGKYPSLISTGTTKLTYCSPKNPAGLFTAYEIPSVTISLLIDNTVPVTFNSYSFSTGAVATNDVLQWKVLGSMDAINFYMIDDKSATPQTALVPNVRSKAIPPISVNPSAPDTPAFTPSTTATPLQPMPPGTTYKYIMLTNFKVRNPAKPYAQTASFTLYSGKTPIPYNIHSKVMPATDNSGNPTMNLMRNAPANVTANGTKYIVNLNSPYIIIHIFPNTNGTYPTFNGYSFTTSTSPNGESDLIGWTVLGATNTDLLTVIDDRSQTDNTSLVPISPDTYIPIIPINTWKSCGTGYRYNSNNPIYNMFMEAVVPPAGGGQRGGALSTYVIQPGMPVTASSFPTAVLIDNKVPTRFNSYTFMTGGTSGADPITWTFQASNDGVNFYLLDDRSSVPQKDLVPDVRNVLVNPPIPLDYDSNQRASSAEGTTVSSARQQSASSSLQQEDSSARQQSASSSVQQQDSSATQQGVSSARQQRASSAEQVLASSAQNKRARASGAATRKEGLLIELDDLRANMQELIRLTKRRNARFPVTTSFLLTIPNAATLASETNRANQAYAAAMKELIAINLIIADATPGYEDPLMQTVVPDAKLAAIGHTKKYDVLYGKFIYYNSAGAVVPNPFPAPAV